MAWEKVALDLAQNAGIDVPSSRLLNLAGRNVLVVERFDRTGTGDRIGYVSAMTMPGPKYLSTAIDPTDDTASLGSALAVAEYFRLPDAQARVTLREVAAAVSQWRDVARRHQLNPSEITSMEPAFAALADAGDI